MLVELTLEAGWVPSKRLIRKKHPLFLVLELPHRPGCTVKFSSTFDICKRFVLMLNSLGLVSVLCLTLRPLSQ